MKKVSATRTNRRRALGAPEVIVPRRKAAACGFRTGGVFWSYEQKSAASFVFVCSRVDWTRSDRGNCQRFCAGVAACAGLGAGAACDGGWDRRADDFVGIGAFVSGDAGVGG